jgi:uncharacterized coiled-coil protein SlyX
MSTLKNIMHRISYPINVHKISREVEGHNFRINKIDGNLKLLDNEFISSDGMSVNSKQTTFLELVNYQADNKNINQKIEEQKQSIKQLQEVVDEMFKKKDGSYVKSLVNQYENKIKDVVQKE